MRRTSQNTPNSVTSTASKMMMNYSIQEKIDLPKDEFYLNLEFKLSKVSNINHNNGYCIIIQIKNDNTLIFAYYRVRHYC